MYCRKAAHRAASAVRSRRAAATVVMATAALATMAIAMATVPVAAGVVPVAVVPHQHRHPATAAKTAVTARANFLPVRDSH